MHLQKGYYNLEQEQALFNELTLYNIRSINYAKLRLEIND